MGRSSGAPQQATTMDAAAVILPGVPLPSWALPEGPVAPEPEPEPAPAPELLVPAMAATSSVVTLEPAPPSSYAPPTGAPLDPPETRPHSHRRDDAAPEQAAVPQLAPAEPEPGRAARYAAVGAAPATAPWADAPAPAGLPTADVAEPSVEEVEEVAQPASRRSRRPLVLVGAVGGVVLLGAVAAFVWPGFLVTQDDTETGVVPSHRTVAPAAPATPAGLTAPKTVDGLTLIPGAPSAALSKAANGAALAGFTAPVAAVYGTGTTPRATVIAWRAAKPGTAADISTAFAGFQGATGAAVSAVTAEPTGTLGGSMSCGTSTVAGAPASVCFWSDATSFGAVTVLRPATPTDGAAMATAIRTAVEQKG